MGIDPKIAEESLLERALQAARDTKMLRIGEGVRHETAEVFRATFGDSTALIVSDEHTFAAAGSDVCQSFRRDSRACEEPFLFGADVWAESSFLPPLQEALGRTEAIPVAVGSGTINDLTKLAAHRAGRPYLAIATAASMDGYTAYGASITDQGSKQTFDCPAPRAVLADLEVTARAPREMNASGYADLFAKGVAGADWIVADALGIEPIEPSAWETIQGSLPDWVASPGGVARSEPACLRRLVVGLLMSGFAMQAARTSRPASGAEHQFSHLWDMQDHTHEGSTPSHGFKVGIGTLASLALYEELLSRDLSQLDVEASLANWAPWEATEARIEELFGAGELAELAKQEMRAKSPDTEELRTQIVRIRDGWPTLRDRLNRHLLPFREARSMLQEAGCPTEPEAIGISRDRLRLSYEQAYYIRRRFTVLDFAKRLGLFDQTVGALFDPGGFWAKSGGQIR